jgi:hypothetical protein
MASHNRYAEIIKTIFERHYKKGATSFVFERAEMEAAAKKLGIPLPKNIGDLVYSFRYRTPLPEEIVATAPEGKTWLIRPAGRGIYRFDCGVVPSLAPRLGLAETKIPDSTPGVIEKYALTDEQALLAKVRYNRLIDVFTGLASYSLQNHLRTTVPDMGQVETDELYIGLDRRGAHHIIPVQAKGGADKLSVIQIEQDISLCISKFPGLICRPIAAQFMPNGTIALFELADSEEGVRVCGEAHYRLVPPDQISPDDLKIYQQRTSGPR